MEGASPGHGRRRGRIIKISAAAAVAAVLAAAGATVLMLHTCPGRIPVHVLPVGQDMSSATAIAVDGPDVWVAGETDRWGGSVTELNASDGRRVRTLTGARYGIHSPTAIAADGAHLWVADGSGSVTELNAADGSWVRTLSGARHGFRGPKAITVAGLLRQTRIRARTLVLQGAADTVVDPRNGRLLAGRIPGAQLVIFPELGHLLFWQEPDGFADVVTTFLLASTENSDSSPAAVPGATDRGRPVGVAPPP